MLSSLFIYVEQRQILYSGRLEVSKQAAKKLFSRIGTGYYTKEEERTVIFVLKNNNYIDGYGKELRFIPGKNYKPNELPKHLRITFISIALLFFLYGVYGVYVNGLYIPGKRSDGVLLKDESALIMLGAFICFGLSLISIVVDHYDKRDNEYNYQLVLRTLTSFSWVLGVCAIMWNMST
ncbi:hypothetical protein ACU5DF_02705 [Aliivibrio wodanis]|uniref:hypothetical protein n=1 Tax=Aliivibrio wodanis TaxID=80852 RepID=UPI00406D2284